ncbi:MAG: fluoride efflux transporter CrcB [Verrucomicrobia bacterium]|nr:fluoride efflux transporter CrcB [Verrucomicrobiota bacterium]
MNWIWVALGSAGGGLARYAVAEWMGRLSSGPFPWGTFLVNALGAFLIGLLGAWSMPGGKWMIADAPKHFLIVGVLGGFTTFSAFSFQTFALLQKGDWGLAMANVLGSILTCLALVFAGWWIAIQVNRL